MPRMPVLTAAAMRAADAATMDGLGLPGFTLMETAGRAAVAAMEARYSNLAGKHVLVCCGKGNNGGDGLVVARVLHAHGAHVTVWLLADDGLTNTTAQHLALLRAAAGSSERMTIRPLRDVDLDAFHRADLLVDALLGIGLSSALRAPLDRLVAWLNAHPAPTVALDVPTGLHSDTGHALPIAVAADLTVTMAAPKLGLFLNDGPRATGHLVTAEIGIPDRALRDAVASNEGAWRATPDVLRQWLPERGPDAHKYSVGTALLVAGSAAYTGAPYLSASAASRTGSGMVVLAVPDAAADTLRNRLSEVVVQPAPFTEAGTFAANAGDVLIGPLEKARAVLVGPGLGRHDATAAFVRDWLPSVGVPAVIDADGLNAFANHTDLLAHHADGCWVLTPHEGEFKRLADDDVDLSDRVAAVRRYAQRWNSVLVLKGLPTLVGTPEGEVWLDTAGTPALATAGTGDVLAGTITGLLAQGLAPSHAAVLGLYLCGTAARCFADDHGPRGLIAPDLIDRLPDALHRLATH